MTKRKIDNVISKNYSKLGKKFTLIKKGKVAKLKASILVAFALGSVVAIVWGFSSGRYLQSDAATVTATTATGTKLAATTDTATAESMNISIKSVNPSSANIGENTSVQINGDFSKNQNGLIVHIYQSSETKGGSSVDSIITPSKIENEKVSFVVNGSGLNPGKYQIFVSTTEKKSNMLSFELKTAIVTATCPQLAPSSPDFCKGGTIVSGGKDSHGCQNPPTCKMPEVKITDTINVADAGKVVNTGTVINTRKVVDTDTSVVCPKNAIISPDFCTDGIIIPGEKDSNGCQNPPTCERSGGDIAPAKLSAEQIECKSKKTGDDCWVPVCSGNPCGQGSCIYPSAGASKSETILACIEGSYRENGDWYPGIESNDASACPQLAPASLDFCKGGTIIPGGKDSQGCQNQPTCVMTEEKSILSKVSGFFKGIFSIFGKK